ncbi:MAG TPA: molybdate ABC transporter substrate-binding protein, partial [Vicinamibacteria bacterium]|nr:molybdate ABC transporter substrate-binding protein [Vicinamibacteria bacterium]
LSSPTSSRWFGRADTERRSFVAALGTLLAVASTAVAGEEVVVFAAASLADALRLIEAAFEARTGHRVVLSLGGSNDLARQIRAGAPAEVFISASVERMDEVERAGLLRAADRVDLLSNRLVVVVPVAAPAALVTAEDLVSVRRLALGDPEAVPAGIYARLWLEKRGLWERLRGRVVPTLDVRAALSAVESGNADVGIVYRTDAAISKRVRVVLEVPEGEAPRIVYPAALLASARGPAARVFFEHLRSREAAAVFERLGFRFLPGR